MLSKVISNKNRKIARCVFFLLMCLCFCFLQYQILKVVILCSSERNMPSRYLLTSIHGHKGNFGLSLNAEDAGSQQQFSLFKIQQGDQNQQIINVWLNDTWRIKTVLLLSSKNKLVTQYILDKAYFECIWLSGCCNNCVEKQTALL